MKSHITNAILSTVALLFILLGWSHIVSIILVALVAIHSFAHVGEVCKCEVPNTPLKKLTKRLG